MKKLSLLLMAAVFALSLGGTADAAGRGGCCGGCSGAPAPEQINKLQADTIDLRQEMMNKRFEAQRENLKGAPDKEKIAALEAEIKAIKAKIMDAHDKSGIKTGGYDGGCGKGGGCGNGYNKGMMQKGGKGAMGCCGSASDAPSK